MKQPKNPFHPGEILFEEFLEPMGISQSAFAEKIGWTKAKHRVTHQGDGLDYWGKVIWIRLF